MSSNCSDCAKSLGDDMVLVSKSELDQLRSDLRYLESIYPEAGQRLAMRDCQTVSGPSLAIHKMEFKGGSNL